MKHICKNCYKEFEGRLNKQYCSDKCRDRQRFLRRKNNPSFIKARSLREKKWYRNGGKKIKLKRQKEKKFRDYQNKWRRDKKYWLEQYDKHKENEREKSKRHRKTLKGKINILKSNERRRKKNILLTGCYEDFLSLKELKIVDERDIVCVYCKEPFNEKDSLKKHTYDHIDIKKPLTLNNAVKCCWSCNSSKKDTSLEGIPDWIKRKGYDPSPIVFELINKNKK